MLGLIVYVIDTILNQLFQLQNFELLCDATLSRQHIVYGEISNEF